MAIFAEASIDEILLKPLFVAVSIKWCIKDVATPQALPALTHRYGKLAMSVAFKSPITRNAYFSKYVVLEDLRDVGQSPLQKLPLGSAVL